MSNQNKATSLQALVAKTAAAQATATGSAPATEVEVKLTEQAQQQPIAQATQPVPAQAKVVAAPKVPLPDYHIFFGEFPNYVSMMTPKGISFMFYQGYLVTTNKDVIAYASELEGVSDITGKIELSAVPTPAPRTRARNFSGRNEHPGIMSPAELLQRSVASSATNVLAAIAPATN